MVLQSHLFILFKCLHEPPFQYFHLFSPVPDCLSSQGSWPKQGYCSELLVIAGPSLQEGARFEFPWWPLSRFLEFHRIVNPNSGSQKPAESQPRALQWQKSVLSTDVTSLGIRTCRFTPGGWAGTPRALTSSLASSTSSHLIGSYFLQLMVELREAG